MRIAFFCPHSDPLAQPGEPDAGGQCVYEARVATALAEAGHEVRCYTRHWGDKPGHEDIAEGATILRYPMGPEGFLRKEDMGPYLAEFTHQVLQSELEWLVTADVFHGHYWDGGATALEASLATGKALAFTTHSLGALKQDRVPDPSPDGSTFRYDLRLAAERRILHASDRIIPLSDVERQAQIKRYGTNPDKIRIVPGGVDVEAYAPAADKATLQAELGVKTDFMVFTTGRIDPRKGFVELVDAIPYVKQALQKLGKTVTFFLPAGPEHPSAEEAAYKHAMESAAQSHKVSEQIRWFQRLSDDDLKMHYAAADLFVCPSPYEPFGLVLVEAFAAGTPVVATCHGGPPEIVTADEDGYLAEPADPQDFGGRIVDVLKRDHASRAKMSQSAMDKARTRYAWSSIGRQIAEVYAEIR